MDKLISPFISTKPTINTSLLIHRRIIVESPIEFPTEALIPYDFYHITIVYAQNEVLEKPLLLMRHAIANHTAKFKQAVVFKNADNFDVHLVLEVECETIRARHNAYVEHGIVVNFPDFRPHVSIVKNPHESNPYDYDYDAAITFCETAAASINERFENEELLFYFSGERIKPKGKKTY